MSWLIFHLNLCPHSTLIGILMLLLSWRLNSDKGRNSRWLVADLHGAKTITTRSIIPALETKFEMEHWSKLSPMMVTHSSKATTIALWSSEDLRRIMNVHEFFGLMQSSSTAVEHKQTRKPACNPNLLWLQMSSSCLRGSYHLSISSLTLTVPIPSTSLQ